MYCIYNIYILLLIATTLLFVLLEHFIKVLSLFVKEGNSAFWNAENEGRSGSQFLWRSVELQAQTSSRKTVFLVDTIIELCVNDQGIQGVSVAGTFRRCNVLCTVTYSNLIYGKPVQEQH